MGVYQAGLLAPLAVGPILGGIFSQTLGWRAIFWFLTIYGAAFLVALIFLLPETLRSLVGNGSIPARGLARTPISCFQARRHPASHPPLQRSISTASTSKRLAVDFLGPIYIICSIEVTFIMIFLAIYYTVWQMTITVMSTLFERTYGLSQIEIGLTFIANGVGSIVGTLTTGKFLDFDYSRCKKSFTGEIADFPLEKARLRTIWLWSGLEIASALVFGWTLDFNVHISVPVICTFVMGWSATSIISVVTTFLVDIYPKKSASATAAVNLIRCLMGAGGTAAVLPIVNGIGVGWTFTTLVGIMVVSLGMLLFQMTQGSKQRKIREQKEMSRSSI